MTPNAEQGTRKDPVTCLSHHEAFDCCRERSKPIVYTVVGEEPKQFKAYPSGRCLWAFDNESPFQEEQDQ